MSTNATPNPSANQDGESMNDQFKQMTDRDLLGRFYRALRLCNFIDDIEDAINDEWGNASYYDAARAEYLSLTEALNETERRLNADAGVLPYRAADGQDGGGR